MHLTTRPRNKEGEEGEKEREGERGIEREREGERERERKAQVASAARAVLSFRRTPPSSGATRSQATLKGVTCQAVDAIRRQSEARNSAQMAQD